MCSLSSEIVINLNVLTLIGDSYQPECASLNAEYGEDVALVETRNIDNIDTLSKLYSGLVQIV